jgi:predicted PurR-regulated permease PerM
MGSASPPTSHEASAPSPPQAGSRTRSWAQAIIAAGVVLFFCNEAELVLVVLLVSVLLAFILAPLVELLLRARLPRSLASLVAVLLLLAVAVGITYLSYNQAASFIYDLPKYSGKIRAEVVRFRQRAETLENNASVLPPPTAGEQKNVVTVRSAPSWTDLLTRGFGSVSQALFAASFVPFLVYFMLSWQHHVRSATVMLFRMENRHAAHVTIGLIASMMRSYMVGNLLVGLFMSAVSTAIFGLLGLPFFYFVGPISGFLSLVPYLGILLALVPPLIVGIGQIQSGDVLAIVATVFGLHLFSLNILYPKFLGNRMQLNPLAVTIALLFWGWLWGAMGLVLAIPITGAMKIVFDHIQPLRPYGAWLGE